MCSDLQQKLLFTKLKIGMVCSLPCVESHAAKSTHDCAPKDAVPEAMRLKKLNLQNALCNVDLSVSRSQKWKIARSAAAMGEQGTPELHPTASILRLAAWQI
jgi:hypothetical protein